MIHDLQIRIERYLAEGKSRTLQGLATKAGVSYSTLRRVVQDEVKTIDLANALGILQVITTWQDALAFLNTHFPESGRYFSSIAEKKQISENINGTLESALLDFEKFVVISLAATPEGTNREQVYAALGGHGAAVMEEMLNDGMLVTVKGRIFTAQLNFASFDLTNQAVQVGHCLRFLRKENIGKKRQHAGIHTDGVDREGQKQIHAILQQALADIDEVAAKRKGSLPIFYGVTMGMFLDGGDEHV